MSHDVCPFEEPAAFTWTAKAAASMGEAARRHRRVIIVAKARTLDAPRLAAIIGTDL
jgi:hypothetical protein